MIFHVLTIFPEMVRGLQQWGVLKRAVDAGLVSIDVRDLRDYTSDRHRTTDDQAYGGGPGMVMLADPIFRAVEHIRADKQQVTPLIYLSPSGEVFRHQTACELAKDGDLILLCGRYEGVDQRVRDHLVDREMSIGDFVLSGGELAAMVVIEAVSRQVPGVVGNDASILTESFAAGILDWPHYTRPENYRGWQVPEMLLGGHHAKIQRWRQEQALILTYFRRPELLDQEQTERVKQILAQLRLAD